jgi:hypothetical protein
MSKFYPFHRLSWLCTPLKLIYRLLLLILGKLKNFEKKLDDTYTCKFTLDLNNLDVNWNIIAITQNKKTLTKEYLQLFEETTRGISNYYATIHKGSKVVAILTVQKINGRGIIINEPESSTFEKIIRLLLKVNTIVFPIIILGHAFRSDTTHFAWDEKEISPAEAAYLIGLVLKKLENRFLPTALIIKDIEDKIFQEIESVNPDYLKIEGDYAMHMKIEPNWDSLKSYSDALQKKYRSKFKSTQLKLKDIVIHELTTEEITIKKHEIWRLYANVLNNQSFGIGAIQPDYFVSLKVSYLENFKIFGFSKENEMVAFSSALLIDDKIEIYYIGMNYSANEQHDLYFNILYHSIGVAITNRKKELFLGRSALDPKARLGCTEIAMNSLFKVEHPIIIRLIKKYFTLNSNLISPKYNPFKTNADVVKFG